MSSSSSEGDHPSVKDLFSDQTLPIFTMSDSNVNEMVNAATVRASLPEAANTSAAAGPSIATKADPASASSETCTADDARPSTSKTGVTVPTGFDVTNDGTVPARRVTIQPSVATRPSGMESSTQSEIRRAMMEGVSVRSIQSGSDRYTSMQGKSKGASHTSKGSHATSIPSEAFSRPLQVRDALTRGRLRHATQGYQHFGLGQGGHPLEHDAHLHDDKIKEEDEVSSEATGTTTETISDSSSLSSTFVKNHSKGSIRAERRKHHLVHKMMKHRGEVHTIMYRYCESRLFSSFLLFVILLNTLSLGAQTWEVARARFGWYLDALDNVFLGIYIMEAVVKIYVWHALYFKDSWNILDFSILIFNIIDFLLPIVVRNVEGFDGAAIFRMLRILRGIRAIRAFRVLRTVKFLSNLTVILNTCLQSIQSMGAIVMLMTLFMYMFAVIGRGLYAKKDPERFGTLAATGFTLFQLLTLDEWFDIYSDMVKKSPDDWPIIIYLILYIVLEYFVFLNLFVAVLVDNFQLTLEAANDAKKERTKVLVDSDDEEDRLEVSDDGSSDITGSSEVSVRPPRKIIDEVYPKHTDFTREHLNYYFQLVAALEYNTQIISGQKKTLDMLVDLCMETNDDADQ